MKKGKLPYITLLALLLCLVTVLAQADNFQRYAGIWTEKDEGEGIHFLIREDGKYLRINSKDIPDSVGTLSLQKEEIETTVHDLVVFNSEYGEKIEGGFYDNGNPVLESFQFGNGDGPVYVRNPAGMSELPLPEYSYTGDDLCTRAIIDYMNREIRPLYSDYDVYIPVPVILGQRETSSQEITVVGNFWSYGFELYGRSLFLTCGGETPAVFHLRVNDGTAEIVSVEQAGDGDEYAEDIARFAKENEIEESLFLDENRRDALCISTVAEYIRTNSLMVDNLYQYGWPGSVLP